MISQKLPAIMSYMDENSPNGGHKKFDENELMTRVLLGENNSKHVPRLIGSASQDKLNDISPLGSKRRVAPIKPENTQPFKMPYQDDEIMKMDYLQIMNAGARCELLNANQQLLEFQMKVISVNLISLESFKKERIAEKEA